MIQEVLKSQRKSNHEKNQTSENRMFRIISKNCNLALRPQIRQQKDPNDQIKIMGGIEKDDSIKQLWLFKILNDGKYQIVNFWTDLVIESDMDGVKLEKGRQKSTQKFQIQFVGRTYNTNLESKREIRIKDSNGKYLMLDGILDGAKYDEIEQGQIYILKEGSSINCKQLQSTYLIIEPQTKKCLDVVRGESDSGAEVCIYANNQRANQRWLFDPQIASTATEDVKYSIINFLSGKRLWFGKKNDIIQMDNHEKIWQIKKKHDFSGQLYCIKKQKFLNRVEDDMIKLESHSNGTKWNII